MLLEDLRDKALFQNTIDIWIAFCEENKLDWYNIQGYRDFIKHLNFNGIKMQKFPLCVKESGGTFERGRDKSKFLEELSQYSEDDSSAFIAKLNQNAIQIIRQFNASN